MDYDFGYEQWKDEDNSPKLLFKYKKVTTILDLTRICESLKEHRIYFSKPSYLNDSMEGKGTDLIGDIGDDLEKVRCDYRVLALSETCFSPVMWSHYADNRSGICLGFKKGNRLDINNNSSFKEAIKVNYVDGRKEFSADINQAVENDLTYKNKDWTYEREWRIIKQTEEDYMSYNSTDLACIVFGEKTPKMIKKLIMNTFTDVPFYCVESVQKKYCLAIRNLATQKLISNEEELFNDIVNITL